MRGSDCNWHSPHDAAGSRGETGLTKAGPRMSEDINVKKLLTIGTALAGLAFTVATAAADTKPAVL